MGKHYNPGNEGFSEIVRGDYVDKTELIGLINDVIDTSDKLICISRPRRFGKSFAAKMICSYYDCSCDSHSLFAPYKISGLPGYEDHINRYNVISLDVTGFISSAKKSGETLSGIPLTINNAVRDDILKSEPELRSFVEADISLEDCLLECVKITGRKFIFVIDEWDALFREGKNDAEVQEAYLNFLRSIFKNNDVTPYTIAAAYITGILPIKKDGSQSAISDFREYSMIDPMQFAPYVGFLEEEVHALCDGASADLEAMHRWYDGYSAGNQNHIYNPYSVMRAVKSGKYRSYWKKTSAAEALLQYIDLDRSGLQEYIVRLIVGESISVNTDSFQNDMETFTGRDDVLTLLIHLGYLSYSEYSGDMADDSYGTVSIPNDEIRTEFEDVLRKADHRQLKKLLKDSDRLLDDTLAGREGEVATMIKQISETNYAPTFSNNEQALRYLIKFAYITCVDQYMRIEELPSGHGLADVVFIPKRKSPLPAIVIELKWDKAEDAAIAQIKNNNYPAVLRQYGGDIILVGITYNTKSKEYSCKIERCV